MTVRAANFSDIPRIVSLCDAARRASRYSAFTALQEPVLKQVLMQMIAGHGETRIGSSLVLVSDPGVVLDGAVVAVCTSLYECLSARLITDVFWFVLPSAKGTVARDMLRGINEWADAMPGPVVQRHGVTDAIGDPERTGRLLARAGMRRAGYIYEKERRT